MQEVMQEMINFLTVLAVAVGIAGSIGVMYSSGLRFWARGSEPQTKSSAGRIALRFVSAACFAACAIVVLFALWLIIPIFH